MPPPFISSEPPSTSNPFPTPPLGVTGDFPADSNRVDPSPPLIFVDGNGYIVLRGGVEARDCEVGWNEVMRAWGTGDEKFVGKNFELLFNAGLSEEHARDGKLSRRWQSKSSLGKGVGGPLFKNFQPPLVESVPEIGNLHGMTPGDVIMASNGSEPQLPHTDVATHPEAFPPHGRAVSGCHLNSFLCLSEEYPVRAMREAPEVRWDTIQIHRGDMLLMVATSCHHGMLALPGARDGPQGALVHLWDPDAKHRHHQPNSTHLDPTSPLEALAIARDLSNWDCSSADEMLWLWEGCG